MNHPEPHSFPILSSLKADCYVAYNKLISMFIYVYLSLKYPYGSSLRFLLSVWGIYWGVCRNFEVFGFLKHTEPLDYIKIHLNYIGHIDLVGFESHMFPAASGSS